MSEILEVMVNIISICLGMMLRMCYVIDFIKKNWVVSLIVIVVNSVVSVIIWI